MCYNSLMMGPLTMKLGTLMYFVGERNNKESKAIYTYFILYGDYAPKLHVCAIKKGKETSKIKNYSPCFLYNPYIHNFFN